MIPNWQYSNEIRFVLSTMCVMGAARVSKRRHFEREQDRP